MTLTSFDVVSTFLFNFYFFLKCLRCYMYGIASYDFMLPIVNIYIVSKGLKEKLGGGGVTSYISEYGDVRAI